MLFRQLFHRESSTFTYLLAARPGAEALLIDPVREQVDQYLSLMSELDVRLVVAVDTQCMPTTSPVWESCESARIA